MGSHLNVKWTDVTISAPTTKIRSKQEGYQACVDSIDAVRNSGLPSLIFVSSDRTKRVGGNLRVTPQAKDSEAAWMALFQKDGDYSVFIPGRFFQVFKVDATDISPEDNEFINYENAPLAILTRKDGSIETVMEGRSRITAYDATRTMITILRSDGFVRNTVPFRHLNRYMNDLERAEMSVLAVKEQVDELKKKAAEYEKKGGSSRAVNQKLSRLDEEMQDRLEDKYEIIRKERELLKEIGLPESRMPSAPPETDDT